VLYQMSYEEIKRYDVGSKYYKKYPDQELQKAYKPLLAEVIDTAQKYIHTHQQPQVFYNIETKSTPAGDGKYHPAPEEFIDRLMAVIQDRNVAPYVIIQSFDVRTLQVLRRKYPTVTTSLLIESLQSFDNNLAELGFVPEIYSPYYKLVTTDLLQKAHALNIKVIPWTVNNLRVMKQLKKLGVDGIITDYPNLFKEL
jgi:glycerophosphoryl diester phosphodiesterase